MKAAGHKSLAGFLNELAGLEKSNHYAVPHDFCDK